MDKNSFRNKTVVPDDDWKRRSTWRKDRQRYPLSLLFRQRVNEEKSKSGCYIRTGNVWKKQCFNIYAVSQKGEVILKETSISCTFLNSDPQYKFSVENVERHKVLLICCNPAHGPSYCAQALGSSSNLVLSGKLHYVCIHQHTSANVSIRQHTSAASAARQDACWRMLTHTSNGREREKKEWGRGSVSHTHTNTERAATHGHAYKKIKNAGECHSRVHEVSWFTCNSRCITKKRWALTSLQRYYLAVVKFDKSTTQQRARDPHHFPNSQLPLINTVFDREHKAVQAWCSSSRIYPHEMSVIDKLLELVDCEARQRYNCTLSQVLRAFPGLFK